MKPDDLLEGAMDAARRAGDLLRSGFGTSIERRAKDGVHNIVTEYDLASERLLKTYLTNLVPDSAFIGEESGHTQGSSNLTWVVDPLDGTVNYAHGIPIFSVSIAALRDADIVLGVVYHPLLDEMFTASVGKGAWLNGSKLSVSKTSLLNDSVLVTGFPYNVGQNPHRCIDQFNAVVGRGLPVRRLGSAALDLAYTAAGRFDAFWEVSLHPWDIAAGVLLVLEAGGHVTHYRNEPFVLSSNSIVASNGIIHNQLIHVLDEVDL
ncbi:MAG: inositol monophosphatase [Ignavibacteria bacterium]|nr:inositol monophosphatase [Ignavibacteria bacterium]